jgi:hypothetical protein
MESVAGLTSENNPVLASPARGTMAWSGIPAASKPRGQGMFQRLNKYGLGVKYAVIGLVGGAAAALLMKVFGQATASTTYFVFPLAGAVGGYIGGRIRQNRGDKD